MCIRDSLYPWPHSLHQLIKHGRLHPEVVKERLWVIYSEVLHQSDVMSIQPSYYPLPAMDGSDIFWVFSSSFISWPPPCLFQADLAGGQLSGAKQIVQQVHTVHRLTNENSKFGSICDAVYQNQAYVARHR